MINDLNFEKYLRVFEKSDGLVTLMSDSTLYDILDDLLVLINANLSTEKILTFQMIE